MSVNAKIKYSKTNLYQLSMDPNSPLSIRFLMPLMRVNHSSAS
jgi:hypothetical protein